MNRSPGRGAGGRKPPAGKGTPLIHGREFLGVQMGLSLPGGRRPSRVFPASSIGDRGSGCRELIHLFCPRCGRYLASALAGASALCPRCGVWAVGQ
ncbi:MAG: hypothetical protein QME79_08570 [Bacillota bacterium]|nr:hypothetical protein [Bacillota bacterium]